MPPIKTIFMAIVNRVLGRCFEVATVADSRGERIKAAVWTLGFIMSVKVLRAMK